MGFVIFCCHKELGIYIFKNFNIFQIKSQIMYKKYFINSDILFL